MDFEKELGVGVASDATVEQDIRMFRHTSQFPAFLRRRILHEEARRLRLECLAEDVTVPNVVRRRDAHSRPGARLSLDETIGFQALKSFGDRQLAHTEHTGEFAPRQSGADGKHASQNAVPNCLIRIVG